MSSFVTILLISISLTATHGIFQSDDIFGWYRRTHAQTSNDDVASNDDDDEPLEVMMEEINKLDDVVNKTFDEAKEVVAHEVKPEKVEDAVEAVNEAEEETRKTARRFLCGLLIKSALLLRERIQNTFNANVHIEKHVNMTVNVNAAG